MAVSAAVLLAALFAWYVKGDLEMAWLYVGPAIVLVTVLIAALASFALPAGFPRIAAGLVALPFGMLLAWIAATTPAYWPIAPSTAWMAQARAAAADTDRIQQLARETLGLPVEVGAVLVDSTDGFRHKASGSLLLGRRAPRVRLLVAFAVGPYETLGLTVAEDGALHPGEPMREPDRIVIRQDAIERRYPGVARVEVGGPGPYSPGDLLPIRLLHAGDDWSIDLVQVLAGGEPLLPVRTWSRDEIGTSFERVLRESGEHATAFETYFQAAAGGVTFFQAPAFDFRGRLQAGGWADLRSQLSGDSLTFQLLQVRRR